MIYTTREININGSTATIDEDIYLFKQDSNIELKFIINDTRFTFQTVESSNVIESSNASYFRVKLLNPYGKTINFPIQEVTDNYIVLLINGELIDEDTEVGDYTIQIRLYDKDKNSKLTLPAIANCIHIQQPIFNEVEENTVDTATIDTASVMMSDEGELPVVDSTGKYIPTLWDTGDTISKAKINHIEKGILQAHIEALANKIPKVTPPEGTEKSDLVTLYNALPESGLVFIEGGYTIRVPQTDSEINKDIDLVGLCSTLSFTSEDAEQCKTIVCYSTSTFVQITSTGTILYNGMCNPDLNHLMPVLTNPNRKKGQVLTMINDFEYGWGDVPNSVPTLCVHKLTEATSVQLTLDSYQIIESPVEPIDLSTATTTKILQLPEVAESDHHVYKIHVLLMGNNSIVYRISTSHMYGSIPNNLTSGKIYECIFTYMSLFWLCQCIEYKPNNAPQ